MGLDLGCERKKGVVGNFLVFVLRNWVVMVFFIKLGKIEISKILGEGRMEIKSLFSMY